MNNMIPEPPQVKPNNYMVFAILTTVFCCVPFGVLAIIYASKVNSLWAMGQYDAAYYNAGKAKLWSIVAAAVGAIFIIAYVYFLSAGIISLDLLKGMQGQ